MIENMTGPALLCKSQNEVTVNADNKVLWHRMQVLYKGTTKCHNLLCQLL